VNIEITTSNACRNAGIFINRDDFFTEVVGDLMDFIEGKKIGG